MWGSEGHTCAAARREYAREYRARRLRGEGRPIEHGTSNGYLLGCRDECPGGADGMTCSEARARLRRTTARAAGIPERETLIDATPAVEIVRDLRSRGHSLRGIARLTGAERTTILALADAAPSRMITRETHRKIISARPSP